MTSLSKKLNRKFDLVEAGCLLPFAAMSVDKDNIYINLR